MLAWSVALVPHCTVTEEIISPPELARDADAATVFLAYPLEAGRAPSHRTKPSRWPCQVVDDQMGLQIMDRLKKVMGHIGMCRYRKDRSTEGQGLTSRSHDTGTNANMSTYHGSRAQTDLLQLFIFKGFQGRLRQHDTAALLPVVKPFAP